MDEEDLICAAAEAPDPASGVRRRREGDVAVDGCVNILEIGATRRVRPVKFRKNKVNIKSAWNLAASSHLNVLICHNNSKLKLTDTHTASWVA